MMKKTVSLEEFELPDVVLKTWNYGQESAFLDEMRKIEKKNGYFPESYASTKMLQLCVESPEEFKNKEYLHSLPAPAVNKIIMELEELLNPLAKKTSNSSESTTSLED